MGWFNPGSIIDLQKNIRDRLITVSQEEKKAKLPKGNWMHCLNERVIIRHLDSFDLLDWFDSS